MIDIRLTRDEIGMIVGALATNAQMIKERPWASHSEREYERRLRKLAISLIPHDRIGCPGADADL